MAWIIPIGIVYTNAKDMSNKFRNSGGDGNAQIMRARTNAQTGNWVFQTSIDIIPKTNMETITNTPQ